MENPPFDGIYQEKWWFSWVMLDSGRVANLRKNIYTHKKGKQFSHLSGIAKKHVVWWEISGARSWWIASVFAAQWSQRFSGKLTACSWKLMVRKRHVRLEEAYFHGPTVSFREGNYFRNKDGNGGGWVAFHKLIWHGGCPPLMSHDQKCSYVTGDWWWLFFSGTWKRQCLPPPPP